MNTISWIAAALATLNLISFGLIAYDKRYEQTGKWRVPEKVLFLAAACFGALGGVLGMQLRRYKTKYGCHSLGFHEIQCVADESFDNCFLPGGRHIRWMGQTA